MNPTIDATQINSQELYKLPEKPVDPLQNFITGLTATRLNEQKNVDTQQQGVNTATSDLVALQKQLEGATSEQVQLQEAQGLPRLQKELSDLNALQTQQTAGYLQGLQRGETAGLTTTGRSRIQSQAQRQNAIDSLFTSSLIQAKQGQITAAQDTVQRAITAKYSPILNRIETQKLILENNRDLLSGAEKKLADARTIELNAQQKQIEKQQNDMEKSGEYLINAMQGNAPINIVNKAKSALSKGASSTEIASILGQYGMTLADRIDLDIKSLNRQKLIQELNTTNPDVGEMIKIDGKDYIRYKDGTISEPVLPQAKDLNVVATRLDEKLKTLDKLTQSSVGLESSAGIVRGTAIPYIFTGKNPPIISRNQVNDWRADAINIVQKLTVDELGRVKSDGVTFGALSNGEREAVGQAATALAAAMIYSGKGDNKTPTGKFKISEDKVVEEFNKIKAGYALDFERRTGIKYEDYIKNPSLLQNKVVDDLVKNQAEQLQEEANYGNYPVN